MKINEVIQYVDLTKRAIKYYEEQGLLQVEKDSNGYRNYTKDNIVTLKEISVYRKLGIGIDDIKILLFSKDKQLLNKIYEKKKADLGLQQEELDAFKVFMEDNDVELIYETLDYHTIGKALQEMIPGFYGYYFMNHFMPYLQISITSEEQLKAYRNILDFWDNTTIKIPLYMKLVSTLMYYCSPKPSLDRLIVGMEKQIKLYLNPTDEEYQKLKTQTYKMVKLKNSKLYKYHPSSIAQRKFMKNLQDKGYNDIFIPNMIALSPKYKEYHNALTMINKRICEDMGLYYDSNYNLVMKNK